MIDFNCSPLQALFECVHSAFKSSKLFFSAVIDDDADLDPGVIVVVVVVVVAVVDSEDTRGR